MEEYHGCHANFKEWLLLESGNGEDIRVRKDKWIPNYPPNKVLHLVAEEGEEWVVSKLIDPDLHCWRRDIIMASFHRDDANAICRIPLS